MSYPLTGRVCMGGSQGGAGRRGNDSPRKSPRAHGLTTIVIPRCAIAHLRMRLLAQARNSYPRSWSWIPGSLAQRKIDARGVNFVAGSRTGMANNAGENPRPSAFFSWDGARFPRISGGSQQFPSLDSEPSIKLTTWGDRIWSQP